MKLNRTMKSYNFAPHKLFVVVQKIAIIRTITRGGTVSQLRPRKHLLFTALEEKSSTEKI